MGVSVRRRAITRAYPTRREYIALTQRSAWGALPALSFVAAFGLLIVALADTAARGGADWSYALFWVGVLVLFAPIAARLALRRVSRAERIGLIVLLGVGMYVIKVLHSPDAFTFGDEFSHWRTANDILSTGHLFNANPLLIVSPYFPGLEIVTTALANVSGLSIYAAGILVIGAARLLIMLALFLIFEQVSGSPRVAGIAALFYSANPNFAFWSAQYSYESLSLPLASFILYAAVRRARTGEHRRALDVVMLLGIAALVMTHHLTAYALFGLLALWSLVSFVVAKYRHSLYLPAPTAMLFVTLLAAVGWLLLVAPVTFGYLGPVFAGALQDMLQLLTGQSGIKAFFRGDASQVSPLWEKFTAFGSVALIAVLLMASLALLARRGRNWARYRSNALAYTLVLASLAYFPAQALRLTQRGSETSNRSGEFLFVAIGFVLALAITYLWLPRRTQPWRFAVFTALATLLFVGGVIIGMARWARLPGPYLVSGDTRAIQTESLTAAAWMRQQFGSGNNVITDRTNELLMGSYGEQTMLHGLSWIFFNPQIGSAERAVLTRADVRFIVVDRRLTLMLPLAGYYYERGEPQSRQHEQPIARVLFDKFDYTPGVNRVFDSGYIIIYTVGDPGTLKPIANHDPAHEVETQAR